MVMFLVGIGRYYFSAAPFSQGFGPCFLLPFVLFVDFYFQPLDKVKGYDVVELSAYLYLINTQEEFSCLELQILNEICLLDHLRAHSCFLFLFKKLIKGLETFVVLFSM